MAEKDKPTPGAKAETAPAAPSKHTFTLERLRQDCRKLFGVTTSTFDGAAATITGEFTVDEIGGIIQAWQQKRVIPANRKESKQ